jgi:hypothetical protein
MRFRELALGALVALACVGVVACGGEDFPNEPRPPLPVDVSVAVTDSGLNISPKRIGAGLAQLTISNQTRRPVELRISSVEPPRATHVPAGGTASLKVDLDPGAHELSAPGAGRPATLRVGPPRPSSSDELMIP